MSSFSNVVVAVRVRLIDWDTLCCKLTNLCKSRVFLFNSYPH